MNIQSMPGIYDLVFRFAAALGIGLLIGAERERRKGEGPSLECTLGLRHGVKGAVAVR
jgi:hypothetical protein